MIGDTSHQMVIDTMNEVSIFAVEIVCKTMRVEVTVEDGMISDYNYKEEKI